MVAVARKLAVLLIASGLRKNRTCRSTQLPPERSPCFAERSVATMPPGLACALAPVLEQIAQMALKIKQYDRLIIELTQTQYPEAQALLEVQGVGHITALTFVLTLGNKQRFRRSGNIIAVVAYRLWIERGRPTGSPEEDWFAAICQIKHNRTSGSVI